MSALHSCTAAASPYLQSYPLPSKHQLSPDPSLPASHRRRLSLRPLRPAPLPPMSSSAAPALPPGAAAPPPFSVLFVCLGNICRSPAAEAVFRDIVEKRGLGDSFRIDSAGTIGYHEGNPADARMRAAGERRGFAVTSLSRPIRPSDFREFDLIVAMDLQNREDILSAYERWSYKETLPADAQKKVKLMCSYCKKHKETEVPDPYYGGQKGFEKVLDMLEDACGSLLDSILAVVDASGSKDQRVDLQDKENDAQSSTGYNLTYQTSGESSCTLSVSSRTM